MLLYTAKKEGEIMNNIQTELKRQDGTVETLLITSKVLNLPFSV